MGNVMSPGLPVFPVLSLQRNAVFGSRRLTNPNLKLHRILTNTLSETHLTHLQGEEDANVKANKWTGTEQKERKETWNLRRTNPIAVRECVAEKSIWTWNKVMSKKLEVSRTSCDEDSRKVTSSASVCISLPWTKSMQKVNF